MDTKRRLTELNVWDYPFFCEFSHFEKLFYWFVQCHADNAGVYVHSPRLVNFHCKRDDDNDEIEFEKFLQKYNYEEERVVKLSKNKIWIKAFIQDTWVTIAAGNNLGLSCYKLLVKHNLLDRFIELYPNSINLGSFINAIERKKKGYANLPLPQGCPRAGTNNNSINGNKAISNSNNNSINGNNVISTSNKDLLVSLSKKIPKNKLYPENVIEGDLSEIIEKFEENGGSDVKAYLLSMASEIDWSKNTWESYMNHCKTNIDNYLSS